eukprot:m.237959 g.237959  ORF g.237959 m.237959 type:complete len:530 (-) comp21502_c0_seq1:261-1850(-)
MSLRSHAVDEQDEILRLRGEISQRDEIIQSLLAAIATSTDPAQRAARESAQARIATLGPVEEREQQGDDVGEEREHARGKRKGDALEPHDRATVTEFKWRSPLAPMFASPSTAAATTTTSAAPAAPLFALPPTAPAAPFWNPAATSRALDVVGPRAGATAGPYSVMYAAFTGELTDSSFDPRLRHFVFAPTPMTGRVTCPILPSPPSLPLPQPPAADVDVVVARARSVLEQGAHTLNLTPLRLGARGAAEMVTLLRQHPKLTVFTAAMSCFGDEGAVAFAPALQAPSSISELILTGNLIGETGAAALAAALRDNRTLVMLTLFDNKIRDAGACAIALALKTNRTLTDLYLGGNEIASTGARQIADMLGQNDALTTLNLARNCFGAGDAAVIFRNLLSNRVLSKLNLSQNYLGGSDSRELAESLTALLHATSMLSELHLNNTALDMVVGLAIAEGLKGNSTLATLNVGNCNFDFKLSAPMLDAITTNCTLTSFSISNVFDKATIEAMEAAMRRNKDYSFGLADTKPAISI